MTIYVPTYVLLGTPFGRPGGHRQRLGAALRGPGGRRGGLRGRGRSGRLRGARRGLEANMASNVGIAGV